MPGERPPGRHPLPTQQQRSAHSSRQTASRPRSKPVHIRLVFRDPAGHLIRREGARLGQQGALRPESRRQKQHQFLFLSRREAGSGGFDLGKSDHTHKRTPRRVARQGNSKTARPRDEGSFRGSQSTTSCGLPRSSPCVGFCVALARNLPLSQGQPRLFSILLGEIFSTSAVSATRP